MFQNPIVARGCRWDRNMFRKHRSCSVIMMVTSDQAKTRKCEQTNLLRYDILLLNDNSETDTLTVRNGRKQWAKFLLRPQQRIRPAESCEMQLNKQTKKL